jgi:hypothetical protein
LRREHPEECRTITMKRRARKRGAPGTSTTTAIQLRRELYGNKCWICGETPGAIDHIKPLAKGGSNWPANLRPICKSCNSTKHATWPIDTKPNFTLIYSARGVREDVDWVGQERHPLTQFERDFFKWMVDPFIFLDNPLYNMLRSSSCQSFDGGKKIVFPIKMG